MGRRAMIQLAWRFLMFRKDSALAQWYRARTEGGPDDPRWQPANSHGLHAEEQNRPAAPELRRRCA